MLSAISFGIRTVSSGLIAFVVLSSVTLGQQSTPAPTPYEASIGSGTHNIHDTQTGSNCGGPINNTTDFTVDWGPLTLVSNSTAPWSNSPVAKLPLIKLGTQWIPGTVTAMGVPSNGIGPQITNANASGQSTYISTLSADGIATTIETGSYKVIYSDGSSDGGTVSSTETIDLNTGQYTWDRTINDSF